MAGQGLTVNATYCMTVKAVKNNRKSYVKGNDTVYVHDIWVTDHEGNEYKPEYQTYNDDTQDIFVPGKPACFTVKFCSSMGDEIVPHGTPEEWEKRYATSPKPTGGTPAIDANTTLALSIAARVMSGSVQATGRSIDEQFKKELFELADDVKNYIATGRYSPLPF